MLQTKGDSGSLVVTAAAAKKRAEILKEAVVPCYSLLVVILNIITKTSCLSSTIYIMKRMRGGSCG